jgi:hypothetical protein
MTQSGWFLHWTQRKWELHAPGCPSLVICSVSFNLDVFLIVILVLTGSDVQEIPGCIPCAISVVLASIYVNEMKSTELIVLPLLP